MQSPAILGSERTLVSSKRQFERAKSGTHIVFDVGMNNGDDSTHYLSKGYQVVAIEANPILVERARARFQKEIAAASVTTGLTFATTAAMFARTGVTSGKTATTETKLTRVGEGGKETRRFFISLEELRKLSSDQDWEKLFFTSV